MALLISAEKGLIQEFNGYVIPKTRFKEMPSKNSLGWEVQKYDETTGWSRVSPVVGTVGMAELLMEEMADQALSKSKQFSDQPVLRVYESLKFPLKV